MELAGITEDTSDPVGGTIVRNPTESLRHCQDRFIFGTTEEYLHYFNQAWEAKICILH